MSENKPQNLEIVTCKDCEYWNKKTEYCKHWSDAMGRTEDAYYTVCTGADFYCEDAKRKERVNELHNKCKRSANIHIQ